MALQSRFPEELENKKKNFLRPDDRTRYTPDKNYECQLP